MFDIFSKSHFLFSSVFTMTQMVHTLHEHKRIDTDMMNKVLTFVAENRFDRTINKDGGDPQAKKQKKVLPLYLPVTTFCCLPITFANSLDPDQDQQNIGPDLDPNCLTL